MMQVTLYDRPPSVRSGEPLRQKVVVQHRSDMLLHEQVERVTDIQAVLRNALINMEQARNLDEARRHQEQVDELKQQADQMILVLKVVNKINTELAYARAELQKAINTAGDINLARKRVCWLEDRMESLLGKRRVQSPSRSDALEDNSYNHSKFGVEQPLDDMSNMSGRQTDSISNIDSPAISQRFESIFLTATQEQYHSGEQTYTSRSNAASSDVTQSFSKRNISPYNSSTDHMILGTKQKGKKVRKKHSHPEVMSMDSAKSPSIDLSKLDEGQGVFNLETSLEPSFPIGMHITQVSRSESESSAELAEKPKPNIECEEDDIFQSEHSGLDSVISRSNRSSSSDSMKHSPSAELDNLKPNREASSKIDVSSPKHTDLARDSPGLADTDTEDLANDYWQSEHHRFEYSEHAMALLSLDPLSYHRMGLAMPGTFVNEVDTAIELPWRPRRGSDVTDIHARALDTLSMRVHRMCGKVKEAAMLSVNKTIERDFGGPSILQNFEVPMELKKEKSTSTITKNDPVQPSNEEAIILPALDKDKLGNFTGNLVYQPHPIPPPPKLPITRTTNTEFPRSSDIFSESAPGKVSPAQRIVDQHNLLEETKFTSSLFKPRTQPKLKAPPTSERHFREMLKCEEENRDKSSERQLKRTLKSTFKMAKAAVRLKATKNEKVQPEENDDMSSSYSSFSKSSSATHSAATGNMKWEDMKPKSGFLEHSGLKWERVKSIVHTNLISPNDEERVDAARHLGLLKCGDPVVTYALRERVRHDETSRVVYESAKSLVLLGCWDEEVIQRLVDFLADGNDFICKDLLLAMSAGKNVQFVDKKMPAFMELSEVLSELCLNKDPFDPISFHAAVCLGRLCVVNEKARTKLCDVVRNHKDPHIKGTAVEILVRQLSQRDTEMVKAVLDQLASSPVWQCRHAAAGHLIHLGSQIVCGEGRLDQVFALLERKLWDDPNPKVRVEVAKALAGLDLFADACEKVEKKLSDDREEIRAQAVVSVGTLGLKNDRIIRNLLEMIELDPSDFVRLTIMRTFGLMGCQDKRVIRILKDKEKGDGPLAREAKRVISSIGPTTVQVKRKQAGTK